MALFKNISSLAVVQICNTAIPLITIPYVLRVVGVENYGLIAFATAVASYLSIIVDYGFTSAATRRIAADQASLALRSHLFTCILVCKSFLAVGTALLLLGGSLLIDAIAHNLVLIGACSGIVVGNMLLPAWLFQGLERAEFLALLTLVFRCCYALAIFVLLKSESQYWLVPVCNSLCYLLIGLVGIYFAVSKMGVSLVKIRMSALKDIIIECWDIFKSRVFSGTYTNLPVIFLGAATDEFMTGIYALAEKIMTAIRSSFHPVVSAFYPYLVRVRTESHAVFEKKFKFLLNSVGGAGMVFAILTAAFSKQISLVVSGESIPQLAALIGVLSLSLITTPVAPVLANGLLILKADEAVARVAKENLICLGLILPLASMNWGAMGAAGSWVFSQAILVYRTRYFFLKENKRLS